MKYILIIFLLIGCSKKDCQRSIIAVNNSNVELNVLMNYEKVLRTLQPNETFEFTDTPLNVVMVFNDIDGTLYKKEKVTLEDCEVYYFLAD